MGKKLIKYTVSVYTEDSVGLLNRISAIFQKRHINIQSFNSVRILLGDLNSKEDISILRVSTHQ